MKTRSDLITAALRRARVVALDETPAAEHAAYGKECFDGLSAELQSYGTTDGFWSNIPEHLFAPLVRLLAADVAASYGYPPTESREKALISVMALMRPDDREEVEAEMF